MNALIVDTDLLLLNDDAQALLLLDAAGRRPQLVQTVAGNTTAAASAAHALHLYELAGGVPPRVHPGCEQPLLHRRVPTYGREHGLWGTDVDMAAATRDAAPSVPEGAACAPESADGVDLLCLGPLTNVAQLLERRCGLVEQLRRVVIMGGAFVDAFPYRGNVTPLAEFNFWVDPDAAAQVLASDLPIELIPLNVCAGSYLTDGLLECWTCRRDAVGAEFRALYGPLLRDHPQLALPMYDQLAATALLQPDLFRWSRLAVQVCRRPGAGQGQLLHRSASTSTVEVAVGVDRRRLARLIADLASGPRAAAASP